MARMPSFLTGIAASLGAAGASGWSAPDLFSIAFAAVLAVLVIAVRRHSSAPRIVAAAMVLALVAVAWRSIEFDLVGWHGFMHGAVMERFVDGGPIPPEDPAFAGGSLRYPWIEHWLMASLSRMTGIHPNIEAIAFEILLFAVFLAGSAAVAAAVSEDPEIIALAVLLAGFGISIFHGGPLRQLVFSLFPQSVLETRIIPIDKFANISAMPPGYAAMVWSAAASLAFVRGTVGARSAALSVAVLTLVAGLFHPLSWTGILAFQGVVVLMLLAAGSRNERIGALWIAAAVGGASLLAFPYLRSIGASESSDGWTGVVDSWQLFSAKAWDLELFFGPLVLLAFLYRKKLAQALEPGNMPLRIILVAIVVLAAAFLFVRYPGRNEYKFLLYLIPLAAVVGAICLRELLSRHVFVGTLVVALFLLPGGHALGVRPWTQVLEPARVDGPYFRAVNASSDALFQWIATQTPPDSVFLSADLRIPALARRGLYIAVDAPWFGLDGWGVLRQQLLQWHIRRPDAVMYRRQHLASIVIDADWASLEPAVAIAEIRKDISTRPLFVHIQNPTAAETLDRTPGFELRFRNAAGSVYELGNVPASRADKESKR